MQQINFYRQRVAINVLAKDIANARDIYDAAEGHAAIGVLSAQFASVEEGVQEVKRWMAEIPSCPGRNREPGSHPPAYPLDQNKIRCNSMISIWR